MGFRYSTIEIGTLLIGALFHSGCIMPMMNRNAATQDTKNWTSTISTSMGGIKQSDVQFTQLEYLARKAVTHKFEMGLQLGTGPFYFGGSFYGKYQIIESWLPVSADFSLGSYIVGQDPSSTIEPEPRSNIQTVSLSFLTDLGRTTLGSRFHFLRDREPYNYSFWPGLLMRYSLGHRIQLSPELTLFVPTKGRGKGQPGFIGGIGITW